MTLSERLEDTQSIYGVIGTYFDALYEADPLKMAEVLLPEAIYASTAEGELLRRGQPDYLEVLGKREAPSRRGEQRKDRICSLTFAGASTALVVANCAIGERYFTDLLTLVCLNSRWWIIAKVFDFEIQPSGTR